MRTSKNKSPEAANLSISDNLLFLLKENDMPGFINLLSELPIGSEFEIKPLFITFNIYKKNEKHIEIHTTVNGWMMTTTTIYLTTLFFFGKIDSSFFNWI